jgi:hypothetical protein
MRITTQSSLHLLYAIWVQSNIYRCCLIANRLLNWFKNETPAFHTTKANEIVNPATLMSNVFKWGYNTFFKKFGLSLSYLNFRSTFFPCHLLPADDVISPHFSELWLLYSGPSIDYTIYRLNLHYSLLFCFRFIDEWLIEKKKKMAGLFLCCV